MKKLIALAILLFATACTQDLSPKAQQQCIAAVVLAQQLPPNAEFTGMTASDGAATIKVSGLFNSSANPGSMPINFWCEFAKSGDQLDLKRTCITGLTSQSTC